MEMCPKSRGERRRPTSAGWSARPFPSMQRGRSTISLHPQVGRPIRVFVPTGLHVSLHRTYFATCADATVVPNLGPCELPAMSPDGSGNAGLPDAPASCRALPVTHPDYLFDPPRGGCTLLHCAGRQKRRHIPPSIPLTDPFPRTHPDR